MTLRPAQGGQRFAPGRATTPLRTAAAADIAGIRALLVHAKDDEARGWYEALEFEPSPTDPYHLFLLMKDLRAMSSE